MHYRSVVDSPFYPATRTTTVLFEVRKGDHLSDITQRLVQQGLLRYPIWFEVLAWVEKARYRLKYGEYEITPDTTPRGLLARIVAGKVRYYPITFVEGTTFNHMLAILSTHPALKHDVSHLPHETIMTRLGATTQAAEGYFFPDTYFVVKGTSDFDVLKRAYDKMQDVLHHTWQGRAKLLPFTSPYEALVLASIIEKETARSEERPVIAGVFIRRLQKKMRLQTDPTVIYGLGADFKGDLHKSDLRHDTPYNTYTRYGLPPTPIAMPSLASLKSAVHPDNGTSLYFVARGDGTHSFSTTLEEHERAVNRYQVH